MTFDPKDYVRTNFPQTEARLREPGERQARVTAAYLSSLRRDARRSKVQSIFKVFAYLVLISILMVGLWLLASWYLMLGIGIAHAEWWHTIPTMSFHAALLIDIFIGVWIGFQIAVSKAASKKK